MSEELLIIDAENAVMGRLASYVAKQALQGRNIVIINAGKTIILGREKEILEKYNTRRARGGSGLRGPHIPSQADRILKRSIRNMLPYKSGKGRAAYKKIKCYISVPKEFEGKKTVKSARGKQGMSLNKISKMLKGK